MNFPNGLGGGWGQSAGNRGLPRFNPSASQGLTHACARERFIGSSGVVLSIGLFVGLSGFVVWFVVTDQWFALGDVIRSWRRRRGR